MAMTRYAIRMVVISAITPPIAAPKGEPPQAMMRAVTLTRLWRWSGVTTWRSAIPLMMISE